MDDSKQFSYECACVFIYMNVKCTYASNALVHLYTYAFVCICICVHIFVHVCVMYENYVQTCVCMYVCSMHPFAHCNILGLKEESNGKVKLYSLKNIIFVSPP